MPALVTRDEVKAFLGLGSADDARIEAMLDPVSDAVEAYANTSFSRMARTERLQGGVRALQVSHYPIDTGAAITITDLLTSEAAAAADYDVDAPSGMIYRLPWGSLWAGVHARSAFLEGADRVSQGGAAVRFKVDYTGGPATVPGDVKLACFEVIGSLINGSGGLSSWRDGGFAFTLAGGDDAAASMPKSARVYLDKYRARPV
ncbi:MAG: hypothetical protein AAFQ81_09275 [Pseudomonadota bacterium]